MADAVGLDFGTTNSAIAVVEEGAAPRLARFALSDTTTSTFRSLLFFAREEVTGGNRVRALAGPPAIEAYLGAEEPGRLMQSLKSFLASRGFSSTEVLGSTYRLEGLIEIILRDLREAAESQFGALPERVVAGRPVRFADAAGPEGDELALTSLEAAYHNAGFREVLFEYEPVAAAYEYRRRLEREELILIADFGGGTSDFCLLRLGPVARGAGSDTEILGTDGVPVAGDAFDAKIIRNVVAPRLGRETEYRSIFDRVLRVPLRIYSHLERWHRLSFLKSRRTMQLLFDLRREALEPEKFDALIHVVVNDLGFQLYRAVEQTKHELSGASRSTFRFHDPPVDIEAEVLRDDFEAWIQDETEAIGACLDQILDSASVPAHRVDRVFMTGGSSFVRAVRALFIDRFGEDRIRSGDELTSVASGLALRALELRD
jgi:hypothetical chaperone protein